MVRKMQGIITKQSPWSRVNNLKHLIHEQAHQQVIRSHTSLIFGVSARLKNEVNIYSSPINEFISVYISNIFFWVKRLLKKTTIVRSYLARAMWNIHYELLWIPPLVQKVSSAANCWRLEEYAHKIQLCICLALTFVQADCWLQLKKVHWTKWTFALK